MASKAIGFLNFKFGADLSGFERAMNKSQKKLKKFGRNVQKTGKSLTMGLTLPIVALGASSLKTFANFEQGMLKVKAISGATEAEFKALTDSAKELGSSTMFTASQVSELQLNLSKLGLTPKEINKSTSAILNLAQATDSDLGQAATVAASTMNAFGLESEDMIMISDVMADAFSSTALDMDKFQTAMASVAPVAKQAGQGIQGTSAILGVLVNNGVEASTAGTALRNIFLDLAQNGMTWDEAMQEVKGSLNPLETAMDLFGKRGAAVATIIANNGTEIQNLTADFEDSSGEAQIMADIMDSGVAGSMRRMQSQLEGAAIQLGEQLIPAFNKLIGFLESAVTWFSSLSDSQKENIVKWGLMLAAVGPILIIVGKMSTGISALIPIVKSLTATLAANPWLILVAAIVLASKAIYDFATTTHGAAKAKQDLLNVEKNAIVAAKEEERILLNKLKLARDVTKTDEERKGAIVDLNNKLVGLNGTLNLENIAETNVTNSINEHTQALINQAKIAGIQDLISENFAKMTKASLDGREAMADIFSIESVIQTGTHFANTVGGVLKGKDVVTSLKDGGKQIVANYMEGLSEEEKVLTAELQRLGGMTPPPIKVKADLGDAGDLMDNWTPPDPEDLDPIKVDVEVNDSTESIKQLEEFYAQSQNLEKQNLVDGVINQEEYNKRVWEDKVSHLEQLKTIHEEYGESTTKIDGEILDAKLAGYKKEEKAIVEVKSKLEEFTEELKKNIEDLFGGFDFEEIAEAFAAAFEVAMALFDSFNEKMRVKAENERIVEMEALDAEHELAKERIEQSVLDEDEKDKKLQALDKQTAASKVAIEEATEIKLAKIKKREAVRNKALAIMSAIINTAKAVSAALPVIPLAIAAGAMGAIQVGIISSTPLPLAEGGIVTGPTTALIGEYAGAGSNPEVVAPLDRLKGLLGESSQHITVTGRLVGNDIWLSNEFAGENRKRFT